MTLSVEKLPEYESLLAQALDGNDPFGLGQGAELILQYRRAVEIHAANTLRAAEGRGSYKAAANLIDPESS